MRPWQVSTFCIVIAWVVERKEKRQARQRKRRIGLVSLAAACNMVVFPNIQHGVGTWTATSVNVGSTSRGA